MKKKIEEMFAFVSVDKDGHEGVVAHFINSQWMPLVGADMERINSLVPFAKAIKEKTGLTIKLLKFGSIKEVLEI